MNNPIKWDIITTTVLTAIFGIGLIILSDNLNFHGLTHTDKEIKSRNVRGIVRKLNNYILWYNSDEFVILKSAIPCMNWKIESIKSMNHINGCDLKKHTVKIIKRNHEAEFESNNVALLNN